MVLEINDNTTVREIEALFSTEYPFLNIVFVSRGYDNEEDVTREYRIHVDKTIGEIKETHVSALVEVQPWYTIAQVEKEFMRRLGLRVEILRKSDSHWILPSQPEALTLKEQNELGRITADHIIHPDYDSRIENSEN